MEFQELKLRPELLRAVREAGYTEPTPIQRKTIPLAMTGRDVLGCAQTGTGKTAAFGLPILHRLSETPGSGAIRCLILTPTRELAIQIQENLEQYAVHTGLRPGVIFGGVGQNPQVEMLRRGLDILVATPGRLNDLCNQGHIDLSKLEIFVLDEADRMLDMGFLPDVKRVIARLPRKRQTLMFSATMPAEIESLAESMLVDPATVKVDPPTTTAQAVEQTVYLVDKGNKKKLLPHLLMQHEVRTALVFTRTKHGADKVVKDLDKAGIEAMAIHGNKSQNARQRALNAFKEGKIWVLVATDIAARGIDIDRLSHVFNYELPNEPETYIHRIGRTGRAGRAGIAVSLCCQEELPYLRDIEKLTGRKIPVGDSPWPMGTVPEEPKPGQKKPDAPKKEQNRKDKSQQPRRGRKPAEPAPEKKQPAPEKEQIKQICPGKPEEKAEQPQRSRRGRRKPQEQGQQPQQAPRAQAPAEKQERSRKQAQPRPLRTEKTPAPKAQQNRKPQPRKQGRPEPASTGDPFAVLKKPRRAPSNRRPRDPFPIFGENIVTNYDENEGRTAPRGDNRRRKRR